MSHVSSEPFKSVGVLMGGFSAEREISLRSGAAIAAGLRVKGYNVVEIDVRHDKPALPDGLDAVFIALHGEFGEDGGVQEYLDRIGLPYTGSDSGSSRKAFDKAVSKKIFVDEGIPTPAYEVISRARDLTLPFPLVIKPVRQGSSIGLHQVGSNSEWTKAFGDSVSFGGEVLVEEYISGTELTVSVVGDLVLPVLEIKAPEGRYDYRAKYTSGVTEYLVPASITADQAERCRQYAVRAFNALGCRGMARIDYRMNECGEIFVLELNTIPGFTETSLLPKAALAAGIEFPDLCDMILRMAAEK